MRRDALMEMRTILLINGPNLDMLGIREPEVYGSQTLADIETMVATYADERGVTVSRFQSNSEGDLINVIHHAPEEFDGIIYNPGAHTHYSYALRDAISAISIPVVEVHISDVEQREEFRRTSVIAPVCVAQVKGLGVEGYCRAVDILCDLEEFACLGEGYRERFEPNSNIFVAGFETALQASTITHAEECKVPAHAAVGAMLDDADAIETGLGSESACESLDDSQGEKDPASGTIPVIVDEACDIDEDDDFDADADEDDGCGAGEDDVADGDADGDDEALDACDAERLVEAADEEAGDDGDGVSALGDGRDDEDFAQPYAADVAAVDVEMLAWARQQLLRNANTQMGVDAFLVRDTANIKWLTALDGVFDEARAHALVVDEKGAYLHTDSRYSNAIRTRLQKTGVAVKVSDERVDHMDFARSVLAGAHGVFEGKVAIEDSITYADYVKAVKALGISSLAASTDVVLGLRAVKTNAELSRMLAAQAVTDAAFVHIVKFMRPGMTEREVQIELDDYMLRHGGEGLAFSSIVATGANGADPHAIPGKTKLEAGQCVVMDFGAKAFGYCSDMTRMVFLGQPDARLANAYEVLRRANETVEETLRPGMTGKQAHELAEHVLAEGGFGGLMGHGLGHGVGLEVHEQPVLNARNERPLVVGNVVTVEPGIYVPGEFGMRLEDCGVVNDNGFEAFSQLGHDMVIL